MLQALREKTSGLIAKILLGLIVITFSFFGIESYFVTQTDDFVAKVGDKKISQQDFRTRFDEFRQQQLQQANGAINASFFEQPAIKRRILDQMIDEQVILPQLGFDYDAADGAGSYQDTCPKCRRAQLALAQSARVGGFG